MRRSREGHGSGEQVLHMTSAHATSCGNLFRLSRLMHSKPPHRRLCLSLLHPRGCSSRQASIMASLDEAKLLISEMCRSFYDQGWVSGTGGGMSIKVGDRIVMAPSGVQKERMVPEDMFVLDAAGEVLQTPRSRPAPYKPPKLSECSPLFMSAYELRGVGAVLHSHSLNAVMATLLHEDAKEFKVTHLEMIKGIAGHGYYGNCVVPIIENTARECELTGRLREAIQQYPESNAVLVRRHGVYVWGKDWVQAKTQAECYDYLFEAALRMKSLGIDASLPQAPAPLPNGLANGHATENGSHASKKAKLQHRGAKQPKAIVLDIEGTVAPISFVTETLFPYARARVTDHLTHTFQTEETQADLDLLRQQAQEDAAAETSVVAIPDARASKDAIVDAATRNVFAQMDADRKTTALKSLQGHIWREGFKSGSIKAELFRDVPDMLVHWRSMGVKSYIYSSGSREAQNNLFGHTTAGDLRPYLSGFFDTSVGPKVEAGSYKEIGLSLGVDSGDEITFATDILAEAIAAKEAGWKAVLVSRHGNKPLPAKASSEFRIIKSLEDLLPFM